MRAFVKVSTNIFTEITLGGQWDYKIPKNTLKTLQSLSKLSSRKIKILTYDNFELDFCGGGYLFTWLEEFSSHNEIVQNALLENEKNAKIFEILSQKQTPKKESLTQDIIQWHKDTFKILNNLSKKFIEIFGFFGEIIYYFVGGILTPYTIRIRSVFYHIQEAIIKATGIIALACFLIGIVIVYQGALQLQQFGASILIVEMSSMLNLREMAPIIAAIIIAGRSASAFSAEIGMMKATQEIDAMVVMGFNPITFLVLPRMIALCLIFPLVVFIADIFSLLGSMFISQLLLGISTEEFMGRFLQMVEMRHFVAGLIKAPFFGAIISLIGCYHGFIVAKDTRSIGEHTTKSVVQSIFCVIIFDALCSIIFTQIGL